MSRVLIEVPNWFAPSNVNKCINKTAIARAIGSVSTVLGEVVVLFLKCLF